MLHHFTLGGDCMEDLSEQITDRAEQAAVRFGDHASGELDFSEASLNVVEAILAEAVEFMEEISPEHVEGLIQDFGCYIHEVARRAHGGTYYWFDRRDQPILVVGEPEYRIGLLTWDRVQGRLSGDSAENIPFYYKGFLVRIAEAEPGDDVLIV
jgi:hypothetical protein